MKKKIKGVMYRQVADKIKGRCAFCAAKPCTPLCVSLAGVDDCKDKIWEVDVSEKKTALELVDGLVATLECREEESWYMRMKELKVAIEREQADLVKSDMDYCLVLKSAQDKSARFESMYHGQCEIAETASQRAGMLELEVTELKEMLKTQRNLTRDMEARAAKAEQVGKATYDQFATECRVVAQLHEEIIELKANAITMHPISELPDKVPFLDEARGLAAQCWCDPETKGKGLDVTLHEAVARRIACWMDTAAQNQRNTDYYRGLVVRCGQAIGSESYIQDDGGESDEVLCAKVPELVEKLKANAITLRPISELPYRVPDGCVIVAISATNFRVWEKDIPESWLDRAVHRELLPSMFCVIPLPKAERKLKPCSWCKAVPVKCQKYWKVDHAHNCPVAKVSIINFTGCDAWGFEKQGGTK